MIDGIGIDVVDIERFKSSLERTPGLLEKLFTINEQTKPIHSLAAHLRRCGQHIGFLALVARQIGRIFGQV